MMVALKLQANLQEKKIFIDVVHEGIMESSRRKVVALRQSIEKENNWAVGSVKLLDQHLVVREMVGPKLKPGGLQRC